MSWLHTKSAFPVSWEGEKGMTLRDWFAGQALIALPHLTEGMTWEPDQAARDAYQIADAMMRWREA